MLEQTQSQHLILTTDMQQALHVLELPVIELSEWIRMEIEQNPVTELEDGHVELPAWTGDEIPHLPSLFEFLMEQARRTFESGEKLELAERIIGSLDERGFLATDEFDGEVLEQVRGFDPPGIGARDVKECLLQQLRMKELEGSLGYQIIDKHYDDLLHNRLPTIEKGLHEPISSIKQSIAEEIVPLDPYPGYRFSKRAAPPIGIDLTISPSLDVETAAAGLPQFRIETRHKALRSHVRAAKWLQTIVARRGATLEMIGRYLVEKHPRFFLGESKEIAPSTICAMAEAIGIHDTTATRAVAGKWVECVQGVLPLRYFFTLSDRSVQAALAALIEKEDKRAPLSDEKLSSALKAQGMSCSRRTVTKYRLALGIPSTSKRKCW